MTDGRWPRPRSNGVLRACAGMLAASLAAGPLFVTVLAGAQLLDGPPNWALDGRPGWTGLFLDWLAIMALSVPFGFVFAILFNVAGTIALFALGRTSQAARAPIVWSLVGCSVAGILSAAMGGDSLLELGSFGFTGAVCALICRSGVRWR